LHISRSFAQKIQQRVIKLVSDGSSGHRAARRKSI
jgi:hypothetical protein